MSIADKEDFQHFSYHPDSGQLYRKFNLEEYGFSFIKSGFEYVQNDLSADFKKYGISVIRTCPLILNPVVVDYIYRDSRREPFYLAMYKHLTTTSVIAMALYSEGQNTQNIVNDLKYGGNGYPSLREKYIRDYEPISEDETKNWYKGIHPNQDEITVRLTQRNVFHAADTSEEAMESLRLLNTYNPEFLDNSKVSDPRIRRLARYILRL